MYAYIVACYFGQRRGRDALYELDKTFYLKKHLDFLKTSSIKGLDVAFVVLNTDDSNESYIAQKIIEERGPYRCEVKLLVRPNINGSYGAWNDTVIQIINDYIDIQYALLLEDDYIPVNGQVMENIMKYFTPETGYLCQYFDNGDEFHLGEIAAISNGVIDISKSREVYLEKGKVFLLDDKQPFYSSGNQVSFTKLLAARYKIHGLNKHYAHPFESSAGRVCYGDGKESIIVPVSERKRIEYIFAAGWRCTSTSFIRCFEIKGISSPLDWLIVDFHTAMELISKRFEDFLKGIVVFIKGRATTLSLEDKPKLFFQKLQGMKLNYLSSIWEDIPLKFNQNYLPSTVSADVYTWDKVCLFLHFDLSNNKILDEIQRRVEAFNLIYDRCPEKVLLFHISKIIEPENLDYEMKRYVDIVKKFKIKCPIFSVMTVPIPTAVRIEKVDNLYFMIHPVMPLDRQVSMFKCVAENELNVLDVNSIYKEMSKIFDFDTVNTKPKETVRVSVNNPSVPVNNPGEKRPVFLRR